VWSIEIIFYIQQQTKFDIFFEYLSILPWDISKHCFVIFINSALGCFSILAWNILKHFLETSRNIFLGFFLSILSWDIYQYYRGIFRYFLGYLSIVTSDIYQYCVGIFINIALGYLSTLFWDISQYFLRIFIIIVIGYNLSICFWILGNIVLGYLEMLSIFISFSETNLYLYEPPFI